VGRPKEFDEERAVDAAMGLFWRQGYAGTSIQDLVDHVGVGRGSIYDTFESKHGLWVLALTKYSEEGARSIVDVLDRPGPLIPRLRRALVTLVDDDFKDPDRKGCMLVNAAMETIPLDSVAADLAKQNFDQVERALERAIRRAQGENEVSGTIDPPAAAALLLTLIEGLRVVAKATRDRKRLVRSIDVALASLV
jgi:TetR/AcrR family transcriptional repressor of nem operon